MVSMNQQILRYFTSIRMLVSLIIPHSSLRQASMSQSDEGDGCATTISRASEALVGYFNPEVNLSAILSPREKKQVKNLQTIMIVLVFVITTLFLMTMAMYKLSSTVMLLEERVHRLESVLDRNRGMVDLLLQTADFTQNRRDY